MKRPPPDLQPAFDFGPPQPVGRTIGEAGLPPSLPSADELRRGYREQILRDLATLRMGHYHPSKEFYEERIALFTEALQDLPTPSGY